MSADICIKPKGLSGKKLSLKEALTEELTYGIYDEYGRFDEGKEGDYTSVFSPEDIGRGFQQFALIFGDPRTNSFVCVDHRDSSELFQQPPRHRALLYDSGSRVQAARRRYIYPRG